MKVRYLLIGFLFVSPCLLAFDFRSSSWGDSKDAVTQQEGTPSEVVTGTGDWNRGLPQISYNDRNVIGRSADVIYTFDGDSLIMGRYLLGGDTGLTDTEAAAAVRELMRALSKKYGQARGAKSNESSWMTDRSYILLWTLKQQTGTQVFLDYWQKKSYDERMANREDL